jgi:hypothetical protein
MLPVHQNHSEFRQLLHDVRCYLATEFAPSSQLQTTLDWGELCQSTPPVQRQATPVAPPSKPAPPRPKPPPPPVEEKRLKLTESPKAAVTQPVDDLKEVITAVYPRLHLRETPPNDAIAQQRTQQWGQAVERTPILILCDREKPATAEMLTRMKQALDERVAEASLVEVTLWEQGNLWKIFLSSPTLKLVVISDELLEHLPNLKRLKQGARLGETRVVVVTSWELFVKQPLARRELWQGIVAAYERVAASGS